MMSIASNGAFKIIVPAIIGLAVGTISTSFYFGTQTAMLRAHANSTAIHEDAKAKEERIDNRVKMLLAPIETELRHIREQLDKIDHKLGG